MAVTDPTWTPSSWHAFPALQQPDWPDQAALEAVRARLSRLPSPISAGEARPTQPVLGAPAAARRISGWTVGHQHIFHPRPNDHAFAISQPGPSAVITVPFDLLAGYGSSVSGLGPRIPAHDDQLFLTPEVQRTRLISLMNDVERLAREEPWVVQMPEPAKALQGTIIEALLACLTQGQPSRDRVAPGRPPHRRAPERALRERPEEMLSLPASAPSWRGRENPEPRLPGVPRSGRDAIRPRVSPRYVRQIC